MAQKTTSSPRLAPIRRATPIPPSTQAKVRLSLRWTNRSPNSAKSIWITAIVLTKKDVSSLMGLTNSAKTINTTLSTKQKNAEVLKTTTTACTETVATSFMWLVLLKKIVTLQYAIKRVMTWRWNWSEKLFKKSQKYWGYYFELVNDLYLVWFYLKIPSQSQKYSLPCIL